MFPSHWLVIEHLILIPPFFSLKTKKNPETEVMVLHGHFTTQTFIRAN
jgi:hypothetical protein